MRAMQQAPDPGQAIRDWIAQVLADKGWSLRHWAITAKLNPSTVQRAAAPTYTSLPSTTTLTKLAEAAGVPAPNVTLPSVGTVEPDKMPIRYEVAAGAWMAVDDLREEPLGYAEAFRLPPYQNAPQWLERVVGDSMDKVYPNGTLLHIVDAAEIGYAPRHGDKVVVQRRRGGGSFVERTVKEVELTPRGPVLWPRSHNPKHQAPIDLRAGLDDGEDAEVQICGKVIRGYID